MASDAGNGLELVVHEGRLAVCRDPADASAPTGADAIGGVLRRGDETTWIGPEHAAPSSERIEGGWRAIEVAVPPGEGLDFALVGVLASIASPLAAAGVSIFALSTFDTDVILVREDRLPEAIEALRAAGHRVGPR